MKKYILGEFYEGDDGRNLVNCITEYLIKNKYELYKIAPSKNKIAKSLIILKNILINRKSELILIYPSTIAPGSRLTVAIALNIIFNCCNIINFFNKNIIKIIVIDMIVEQYDLKNINKYFAKKSENSLFNLSTYIFVPHENYKAYINNCNLNKIKTFGIYRENMKLNNEKYKEKVPKIINICMAGNLSKIRTYDVIINLPEEKNIRYNFYGTCGEWINQIGRKDLKYYGTIEYSKLHETLSKNTCGLIIYSGKQHEYFKFALSAKLSTYINARLPIITLKEYKTLSDFVNKMNIGICIDKISDIVNIDFKSICEMKIIPEKYICESKYELFIQ